MISSGSKAPVDQLGEELVLLWVRTAIYWIEVSIDKELHIQVRIEDIYLEQHS